VLKNPDDWEYVVEAMAGVMHGPKGTARRAGRGAPYKMAGKTGTAQVFSLAEDEEYDADEVRERLRDHALFIGFAPVDNPRIAVAVIVENGGSGSGTAAPVARALFDSWLLEYEQTASALVSGVDEVAN
jgi:penicillin-binding protein 2